MKTDVAMAQTYADIEDLLHHCCNEFNRRCPGHDYDDLFGQSCLTFVTAYNQYDPSRCDSFANYLCICVTRRLYQQFVDWPNRRKRAHKAAAESIEVSWSSVLPDTFRDLTDVWMNLSHDASRVVTLALGVNAKKVGLAADRIKRSLVRLGWTSERVDDAFQEVREALQ